MTFSLPPNWRDRPEDSVSDTADVTSASGGVVVSEGDQVAMEMKEVLVCSGATGGCGQETDKQ